MVQGHFHVIFVSAEKKINLDGVATNAMTTSVSIAIRFKKTLLLTLNIFLLKKLIPHQWTSHLKSSINFTDHIKVKRMERKIILMILTVFLCVISCFIHMFSCIISNACDNRLHFTTPS